MLPLTLFALGLAAALHVPGAVAEDVAPYADGAVPLSSSDQSDIINKHNALRRGVQPSASNMLQMSWSHEASANAQRWANTCSMKHSNRGNREISTSGCGENLYMSTNKRSWKAVTQAWYDEVKDWRYGVGSVNGGVVGHFTQVVWYRSNQLGCAVAHCPFSTFKYFYVCHYCPPGNYQLTHPYKSGTTCGNCTSACNNQLCNNPCRYTDRYSNCPELKQEWGCGNNDVASWCPATCKCTNEII